MRLQVEQMIITAGDKLTTNKKLTSKFFVEALKKQNVKKTNNKEQRSFKTPKCSACKVALTWYIAARSVAWDREARGPFRLRTMLHHVVSTISERKFVQKYMSVMGAHVLNVRKEHIPNVAPWTAAGAIVRSSAHPLSTTVGAAHAEAQGCWRCRRSRCRLSCHESPQPHGLTYIMKGLSLKYDMQAEHVCG